MPITIDIGSTQKRFQKMLQAFTTGRQSMMNDMVGSILIVQKEAFATQGGAFGKPWARLAASTVRDKTKKGFGGKPILERTGTLKKRTTRAKVTPELGEIINATPYAKYHQYGTSKMPQRKILDVKNDAVRSSLRPVLERWVIRLIGS